MESLRPSSLSEFVGQERVRTIIDMLCLSAKKQCKPVKHLMLTGQPGLGKSSLAQLVAITMGSRIIELVASNLQSPDQMVTQLLNLKPNDILFLDEVHGLGRPVEEVLYSALEDRKISVTRTGYDSLMKQIGLTPTSATVEVRHLPPFTCITATTLPSLVSDPLKTRLQILNLEPYSDMELATIASKVAVKLSLTIENEVAMEIATRSRGTARVAVGLVSWLAEFCSAYDRIPNATAARDAFALKDVDSEGLTSLDRAYLSALIEADAPQGISTIAASIGESKENLAQSVEPFLIRKGYIQKGPRGRVALPKAIQRFGPVARSVQP